jgi:dimeric dUTPase (all-alpha-NTP-PPase superfamily)
MIRNETIVALTEKQKVLDERIMTEFGLDPNDQAMHRKKMVAFFVELGEFINEERSFKYWSRKKTNDRHKVIEEYIDGLHFILSIGLHINYDFEGHKEFVVEGDLYESYIHLFEALGIFVKTESVWDFRKVFSLFLRISDILEISEDEIVTVYNEKNAINHQRQDNSY